MSASAKRGGARLTNDTPGGGPHGINSNHGSASSPGGNASVLEQVLERRSGGSAPASASGSFSEAAIASWDGRAGRLTDGRAAEMALSCLVRPETGDSVVVWSAETGKCRVVAVLDRDGEADAVLSTAGPLTVEAPRVGVLAKTFHVTAGDFLSNTKNRHAVERTRTEAAHVRVAEIGTDIRRATTADDEVTGTMLQRTGTWISKTVREARFKAKAFMFD